MPVGHIELRKRAERFNNRVGTTNPTKVIDPLDRMDGGKKGPAIPKYALYLLLFVVCGGFIFQMADQIFKFLTTVQQVTTKK